MSSDKQNLHSFNRCHLGGNRRRLECNRRRLERIRWRLESNRRQLEDNRRRLETKCYSAKTRFFNLKKTCPLKNPLSNTQGWGTLRRTYKHPAQGLVVKNGGGGVCQRDSPSALTSAPAFVGSAFV